jgi:hypothetical protein
MVIISKRNWKTSKRRSKRFRTTTSINETKCWEKEFTILMNKRIRKHKEKMKKKIDNLKSTNLKKKTVESTEYNYQHFPLKTSIRLKCR